MHFCTHFEQMIGKNFGKVCNCDLSFMKITFSTVEAKIQKSYFCEVDVLLWYSKSNQARYKILHIRKC